ncbi:helix-turn-helix transcriptional regulator [Variovorax sp. YR566]|uniref:helix-turn-helix transcriptional regulator n=1 Tax=Variovorax sp. YR566 TaxID=3450237 RepID=UPI003F8101C0
MISEEGDQPVRRSSPQFAEASFEPRRTRASSRGQEAQEGAAMPYARDTTTASQKPEPAFYRLGDVIRITALSRSTIYRRIAAGAFPPQVSLGGRAKGWRREALQAWVGNPSDFHSLTK